MAKVRSLQALLLTSLAYAVTSTAAPARALTLVTSRAALGETDSFDWGSAGSEYSQPSNPFSITSVGSSRTASVSEAQNTFELRIQSSSWSGNFAPGDNVLWSSGVNGPITIAFNNPVSAVGTQIMSDYYGPFTATISAYDVIDNLLGSFSVAGNSDGNADNSAIFIGAQDSSTTIAKIILGVPVATTDPEDFAINRLSISTATPGPSSVPAPLPIAGVSMLFAFSRRLRKRTTLL